MTNVSHGKISRGLLALIILAYLIVGIQYAYHTPAWQAPDEPAHFNYVRFLAEELRIPVLQPGDYPHDYLEEIKTRRFPPEMSIEPIRYEFHQPPLYYTLAAVIYSATRASDVIGQVHAIRLLSVALGACLLLVAYRLVRLLFPHATGLALGATAFIAFLPMHVATNAAISNDVLAVLLLSLVLLTTLRYMKERAETQKQAPSKRLLLLGVLVGLAFLTKSSVYIAAPVTLAALAWGELGQTGGPKRRLSAFLRTLALVFVPALLLGCPWWIRNAYFYGGVDVLGLARHDMVVLGQPRAAEWIAEMGLPAYLSLFLRTTFQSFWGQFGWMGVLLDSRLYALLGLFSGLIGVGAFLAIGQMLTGKVRLATWQGAGLAILCLSGLLTLAGYLWYNLQFVQHQGRYLFPGLIPIGILASAGIRQLLTRQGALISAGMLIVLAGALLIVGLARDDLPQLWLSLMLAGAVLFALRGTLLPENWHGVLTAVPYAGMWLITWICLCGFIRPYFAA